MSKPTTTPQKSTQEIARDRWNTFLADFTRQYRGAHARLEVIGSDVGYQVETHNQPFDGVSADYKDGEDTVWIIFGATPEEHHAHGVDGAIVIRLLAPGERAGAVLEVETRDGTKTLLMLSRPEDYALPKPKETS